MQCCFACQAPQSVRGRILADSAKPGRLLTAQPPDEEGLGAAGRKGRELKVHGFRVDPAEVEAVLRALPGITDAAVLVRDGGGGVALVAYVVAAESMADLSHRLRYWLGERLPVHMRPAEIVQIEAIPRLDNFKLDAGRLAEIDAQHQEESPPSRDDRPFIVLVPGAHGAGLGMLSFVDQMQEIARIHVIDLARGGDELRGLFDPRRVLSDIMGAVRGNGGRSRVWLIGYAAGAKLAFEAARQLHAAGEPVDLLGFVDGEPGTIAGEVQPMMSPRQRWREFCAAVGTLYRELLYQRGGYAPFKVALAATLVTSAATLAQVGHLGLLKALMAGLKLARRRTMLETVGRRTGAILREQRIDGVIQGPYPASAILFSTGDPAYFEGKPTDLGWSRLCANLSILPVNAPHATIWKPAYSGRLIACLRVLATGTVMPIPGQQPSEETRKSSAQWSVAYLSARSGCMRGGAEMKSVLLGNKPDKRAIIVDMADHAAFKILPQHLDEHIMVSPQVDLIVPFMLSECDLLRASPIAASRSLIPKAEHVRLAQDKLLFNHWLIEAGFGDCVPRLYDQATVFPLMRRARIDHWGQYSRLIRNKKELAQAEAEGEVPGGTFLQECVSGREEQATHIIAVEGRILFRSTVTSRHRHALFVKGKYDTATGETGRHGYAPPAIISIVQRLGYTGAACFDYKMEGDRVRLFELNPRIGGSFYKAGGDYLAAYACGVSFQARLFP